MVLGNLIELTEGWTDGGISAIVPLETQEMNCNGVQILSRCIFSCGTFISTSDRILMPSHGFVLCLVTTLERGPVISAILQEIHLGHFPESSL